METKDFEILYNNMLDNGKQGSLTLLTAPTGTGKSYTIIKFLSDFINKDKLNCAFFITDQKINLPIDDFKVAFSNIDNQGKTKTITERDFYRKVAVIRSLGDTCENILNEIENDELPKIFSKTREYDRVVHKLNQSFKSYQDSGSEKQTKDAYKELKNAEFAFREYLTKQLKILAKTGEADLGQQQDLIKRYLATKHGKECQDCCDWVNRHYPTIDLERRQLYIMTTAKFIRSYTPFFQYTSQQFTQSKILKNSLVVFDEFDSTKGQLLNKAIDDSWHMRSNFIDLFSAVAEKLKKSQEDTPTVLKKLFKNETKIAELIIDAQKLEKRYRLDLSYKSVLKTYEDNFVLHLPYAIKASRNRKWWSELNYAENYVKLLHSETSPKNDLHFYRMLGQITGFVMKFASTIQHCAQHYAVIENNKRSRLSPKMSVEDATYTIYSALHFSDEQKEALTNVWGGWSNNRRIGKKNVIPETYHQFQKEGLDFYVFSEAERHALDTKISATTLNKTPENFLLTVLRNANLLGLSATAELPTVLNNYDLDYLREQLGERFISGYGLLTPKTKESFKLKDAYKRHGIEIEVSLANIMDVTAGLMPIIQDRMKMVQKQLPAGDRVELNKVVAHVDKYLEGLSDYYKERYFKLFDSFVLFMISPALATFLGLQSVLPKDDIRMETKFVQEIFEALANILCRKEKNIPKLDIISKSNQVKTPIKGQIEKALSEPNNDRRVYLLSAYQTLSVGQNLQHDISEIEKGHYTCIRGADKDSSDKRYFQIDLGGIYLGDVTHVYTDPIDLKTMRPELIRLLAELEYLLDNGEISKDDFDEYLLRLEKLPEVLPGEEPVRRIKQFTKARSYMMSYTRAILQAVGRMDRTHNKVSNPQVIVTENVLTNFSISNLNEQLISPEGLAIAEFKMNHKLEDSVESSDQSICANRFQNLTYLTFVDFRKLVLALQSDKITAQRYRNLREFFLINPTIGSTELGLQQKEDTCGLQYLPINKACYTAYPKYKKVKDKDGRRHTETGIFKFDGPFETQIEVSEASSGLTSILKYPGLRQLFEHNGYATEWNAKDYVLNPVQFINAYLGILGEVAGKFILEDNWQVNLSPITQLPHNELFDFRTQGHVLVDFKNWRGPLQISPENARQQVKKKLAQFESSDGQEWRAVIINILQNGKDASDKAIVINDGSIMEVSALINVDGALVLTMADKKRIGDFLRG